MSRKTGPAPHPSGDLHRSIAQSVLFLPDGSHRFPLKRFALILFFFLSFISFPFLSFRTQPAHAASSASKIKPVENPNVVFSKGLLTVQAKDVRLQMLMDGIGMKTSIEVSRSPALQKEKITVQFKNVPFKAGPRVPAYGGKSFTSSVNETKRIIHRAFVKSERCCE